MSPFKRLVVGVDFAPDGRSLGEGSRRALGIAVELLSRRRGELLIVHSTFSDRDDWIDGRQPVPQADMRELCQPLLRPSIPTSFYLGPSRPWLELMGRAQKFDADLIVVGRCTSAGHVPGCMGVVPKKLLRKSAIPVWVVPTSTPMPMLPLRRVLVAQDLTPVGDRAAQLGGELAELFDAELQVLHAYGIGEESQRSWAQLTEVERASMERSLVLDCERRVRASLGPHASRAHLHVVRDAPAAMIREAVATWSPDLLVMGSLSRRGIPSLLIGNTAERVLERAPCGLLSIKPQGFRWSVVDTP